MSSTAQQQLILRVTEEIAQQIRAVVEQHSDILEQTPLIIEIEPENESGTSAESSGDYFNFHFNNVKYPALLLNLPTFIETQKTFDNKIFYKSGDIGQILYVFETKAARDSVKRKETMERHSETYYLHGLSAPTHNIVKSRFELTQKSSDSYPSHKVRAVVNDMSAPWTTDERPVGRSTAIIEIVEGSSSSAESGGGGSGGAKGGSTDFVEVTEEIVDFEEWMVDPDSTNPDIGVSFRIEHCDWDGDLGVLLEHPEILNGPDEGNIFVTK